ncbi:ComEC/Rec2 family competence protein [Aquiflexum gelatinilyticum]|uniref:ComEC/Rec2 family competence protein n=1 Tax=Aquiflexum gelatinilyticum TaxID=2961943 RepID=UPI00216A87B0|nr:ComEC/Rec2 family competence protein [Aquiflexum gelatinilyticum]MCS4436108.1 ComEC family competence protein [Aquiflexum gelatinilyticum]
MRFSEFPFLRYAVFFILGIVFYPLFEKIGFHFSLTIWMAFILIYLILVWFNSRFNIFKFKTILPTLAYCQLLMAGYFFTYQKDIRNHPNNLVNSKKEIKAYLATVISHDEPKPNSIANRVNVKKVFDGSDWEEMEGEFLIYHRSEEGLSSGDLILVSGSPQKIKGPTNPFEFDYRKFMLNQQISHQHFIGERFEKFGNLAENPVETFFIHVRSEILSGMDSLIHNRQANQVAKAILLGQKKDMDRDISDAYVTAGAMHILAVSGLHVGIVYGFFFLFIKPYRLKVKKRVIYLSMIILLIWGYALLTGMSPSVMRSATMFSLMALAQMKSRNPSIFNAIALSAVILLMYDPFLIYAVGFQLSYLALIGILVIQPLLVRLWSPTNRIVDYIWQITTVSFAAQLATFPISAYYFHVFPTYFAVANLVAIPGAFLMMALGVPLMVLIKVPYISLVLAWVTEKTIIVVNTLIFWFQELPGSRISDIYFSSSFIWVYWLMLSLFILLWLYPGRKMAYTLLVLLGLVGISRLVFTFIPKEKNEITLYAAGKGIALDYHIGETLFWYDQASEQDISYKVMPNRNASSAKSRFPMVAFETENGLEIPLEGLSQNLIIQKNVFFLPQARDYSVCRWEENKWTSVTKSDSILMDSHSYKIILNSP